MKRRTFLKLVSIGGAASLAVPVFADQPDVRGWRFGVWELQNCCGEKCYWARCDCGAEQAVGLDKLLSMDALSCDHVRVRGYFCIDHPGAMYCQSCGEHRRFFFNGQGLRIWRCRNWCEAGDVYAFLRKGSSPESSIQFLANMRKMLEDPYDRFLRTLRTKVIAVLRRDRTTFAGIQIDPIEEVGGEEFRFIRLWVEELERPLAWYHRY